jgi:molybdate transport system permease protein
VSLIGADDLEALALSLRVAGVATLGGLPLALGLAYILTRTRLPGRRALDAVITLPLVLPPVATGFGLLILFGRHGPLGALLAKFGVVLAFHWTGAALASTVMALPLMVRPIRQAMEAIDPDLEDAARALGAGPWDRFFRVTAPLAAPGIAAGAILGFARALGEFGATITFAAAIPGATLTLPADIYQATQTPGQETHALALCGLAAFIALAAAFASEALAGRIAPGSRAAPTRA